jgi:hypothetical protein
MFSKVILIALLILPVLRTSTAWGSELNCDLINIQQKDLTEVIRPEILGNLYATAMLKIATVAILENYETFEDTAKSIIQKSKKKSDSALKNRVGSYNYWPESKRITNADFALVASLLVDSQGSNLSKEELGALNLVYLANKNESKISFSKIINQLISKNNNLILVTSPQLQLAMNDYPTSCLQNYFSKNKLVNIINKINMAIASNLDIVTITDDKIFYDNSILVKLPLLKLSKKKYDPSSEQGLNVGERLLSEVGGSFNSYRKSTAIIHNVSNLETIKHFHQFYGLSNFVVLNKKEGTITLFDESARVLRILPVIVSSLDDRMNAGGAGIYYGGFFDGVIYYSKAISDKGMREVFRLKQDNHFQVDGPLYILPTEINAHKFRIKNKRLAFSGYQFYRKSQNYNYSIDTSIKFRLEIKNNYKSNFVINYINTLEKEKSRLMQILKIDNDDYNILAGFAIGVLSPESNFGKNWKYVLKEFLPGVISLAKGNGLDTSKNSRGPTQLKVIPDIIMDQYGITKVNLTDPENAAVATIAISADFLKQLRNLGVNDQSINEENIQNYIYYLYQGKRVQIKEASATPENNLAIKKIMNVVNGLEFLEY